MNLYLAPLQGFTDAAFRTAWQQHFTGIDAYFAPYITLQNDGSIKNSQWRDILPERNEILPIPQILAANADEASRLTQHIADLSVYKDVNLNLGCPYPMVTNRGRGSALLQHTDTLREILDALFSRFGESLSFSVKLRCGLQDFDEVKDVVKVLNDFPVAYSILHPRIAKQLYKGKADHDCFADIIDAFNHALYYNGDIYTLANYNKLKERFPSLEGVMLGRGILENPLLPEEIKNGIEFSSKEKLERLSPFVDDLLEINRQQLSGDSHLLSKMKSYLPYFMYYNLDNKKAYKKMKKAKGMNSFLEGIDDLLRGL